MAQTDALLRLFFKIDPTVLEDDEYAEMVAQMWWSLETTGKAEKVEGGYKFIQ